MIASIPLLIIPFVLFNMGLLGLFGSGDVYSGALFTLSMMSGGQWTMTLGDLMVVGALVLLFVEIVKATRTSNASVIDHLLSAIVFIAFLIEFLLVRGASTSLFFILTVIALIDLLAGFSVSIRSAGRDVSFN
ncbi:MAG: hypothetical protein K8H74_12240 [Notoacmeibacter sp.]|nr:hypothetical protein [Notoacmeibacter sp.]